MVGCPKCRHSANGCAACNPERFTPSRKVVKYITSRKADCPNECAKAFRSWLVTTQGLTEGTSRDYAWAFKCLVQRHGEIAKGTDKMQQVMNIALSKIQTFVKSKQFENVRPAAPPASGKGPLESTGKKEGICSSSKVSEVSTMLPWECQICTYQHEAHEASLTKCSMCEGPRKQKKADTSVAKQQARRLERVRCPPDCPGISSGSGVVHEVASPQKLKRVRTSGARDSESMPVKKLSLSEIEDAEFNEYRVLKLAELNPLVQALLEAGDESDSLESN